MFLLVTVILAYLASTELTAPGIEANRYTPGGLAWLAPGSVNPRISRVADRRTQGGERQSRHRLAAAARHAARGAGDC